MTQSSKAASLFNATKIHDDFLHTNLRFKNNKCRIRS